MGEMKDLPNAGAAHEWRGIRVLVTGGTGFIGTALIKRLLEIGAEVHALAFDSPNQQHYRLRWYPGDIRNGNVVEALFARADPLVVFHLAALSQVEEAHAVPLLAYETNVYGTARLLEAARNLAPKLEAIVIASSDKAYGPSEHVLGPGSQLLPEHPYDASKAAADIIAQSYLKHYDMPIGIMRTANVYGPGDTNLRRIVPYTIYSALHQTAPILRSKGTPIREYLYIDDCVEGYISVAQSVRWQGGLDVPAVLGGDGISVSDLAWKILRMMGSPLEPIVGNYAVGETDQITLSGNVELGRPFLSLDAGLHETIDWMEGWLGLPVRY